MSETYSEIIVYDDDQSKIAQLNHLFDPSEPDKPDFGGYRVERATINKNSIIASILSSSAPELGLTETLTSIDPDWLCIENDYTSVGETAQICLRKGNKRTTRKTLLKQIRQQSRLLDLYFAVRNREIDRLRELLLDESIALDVVVDGCPLLFYLMPISKPGSDLPNPKKVLEKV